MKTLIIATIFLTLITVPAFSQSRLSPEDLDKIKLIVIEVVKKEITDSETRMKDYVNVRFDALQKEIGAVEKQIESVDKRVTQATNIIYGLIALIVVAVGHSADHSCMAREKKPGIRETDGYTSQED